MKKKKQKHRLKEIEKRSSEKGMDLMEAYTEKPAQEEVYCCHEKRNSLVVSPVIDLYPGFMLSIEFLRKKIVEICKLVFQMWINCVQKINCNSLDFSLSFFKNDIWSQSENFQNSLMSCIVM